MSDKSSTSLLEDSAEFDEAFSWIKERLDDKAFWDVIENDGGENRNDTVRSAPRNDGFAGGFWALSGVEMGKLASPFDYAQGTEALRLGNGAWNGRACLRSVWAGFFNAVFYRRNAPPFTRPIRLPFLKKISHEQIRQNQI